MAAQGTQFREHSLFYNDVWRVSARLSLNLGVRWDKNHGVNNAGQLVSTSATFSPRLGVMWDPNGNGKLAITGGFAKYAAALANTIADSSSPAGQISTYRWNYQGPSINANSNGPLVSTEAAIQQVFDWFNANGGLNRPALSSSVPGVSTKIADSLQSPYVLEYSTGVNRQIARGAVRIDGTYRNYQNFYATVTDTTTGRVTDSLGRSFDLSLVENTDVVQREYAGVATTVTYRIGRGLDTGVSYTLSHAWGNVDAEAANGSGPSTSSVFAYPEYKNASWNNPAGDLAVDQRHRANFWATYALPFAHGVTLSAMQQAASGIPYAAVGTVNATPFVSNPGYVTRAEAGSPTTSARVMPIGRRQPTAQISRRTTRSTSRHRPQNRPLRPGATGQRVQPVQVCACGDTVFKNGGGVDLTSIDQSVLTRSNTAAVAAFNPFTTTPTEGTNWALGPNFGKPLSRFAYTTPRMFRLSFGVRF